MTNREAIKIINQYDMNFHWNDGEPIPAEQLVEAFDLAMAALEQQEQDRWHSVTKEGNPPKSGLYIVVDNSKMDGNNPHTRYFNARGDASFWSGGGGADEVIAWKEIVSEPYKAEEEA